MTAPREDFLVSVCLADPLRPAADLDRLIALAATLDTVFRYWEILIVTNGDDTYDCGALLATIKNLRILRTRSSVPFYRRRVISATEAIGDIVLLTSLEEIVGIDVADVILHAAELDRVIVGRRDRRHLLVDPVLALLGRAGGVRAGTGETLTVVYPRTILNQLLARPDRALALRFPFRIGDGNGRRPARTR